MQNLTDMIVFLFQDAFVEYFPDHGEFEEKMWKGVLFATIGLGALATVVATR